MTIYFGLRGFGDVGVFVQERRGAARRPLNPYLFGDPPVYGWGSVNDAAVATAEALLLDRLGHIGEAKALAYPFASAVIGRIGCPVWSLTGEDIDRWVSVLRDDPVGFMA